LFNLLSQQSLKLRDRFGQTMRQAKLTATWGVQILLYPIYALFQSARLVDRQIKQTARKAFPRLQAVKQAVQQFNHSTYHQITPTADTPIQRTLQTVQNFVLPFSDELPTLDHLAKAAIQPHLQEIATPAGHLTTLHSNLAVHDVGDRLPSAPHSQATALSPTQPSGQIQGVASLLATHHLVLVTTQNQLLDILTLAQQHHLQQRIAWELADYWRHQHLMQLAQQPAPSFLPPPADRNHLLPPVRLFRRLMGWMQTSPVAIAINLFQEAQFILYAQEMLQREGAIAHPSANPSSQPLLSPQLALSDTVHLSSPPSPERFADWRQWMRHQLGKRSKQSSQRLAAKRHSANASPPIPLLPGGVDIPFRRSVTEIWNHLFAKKPAISSTSHRSKSGGAIAKVGPAKIERVLEGERAIAKVNEPTPTAIQAKVTPPSEVTIQLPSQPESELASLHQPADEAPYIDTKATLVEYEKHPLEQVLEWLDVAMLWLEEAIAKIWKWIRRLW
jgi:hypothetical protein